MMGTKVYDNALDLITFSRASGGTYLDSDGLLKTASNNTPRIEYAADGTLKGLLVEEQRTNLLPYSEDFSNASWVKVGTVTVSGGVVGPDGNNSAYEINCAAAKDYIRATLTGVMTAGGSDTQSIWVKKKAGGATHIRLTSNNSASWGTGLSTKIELTDQWTRVHQSGALSNTTSAYIIFGNVDENNAGDPDCVGASYIAFAQVEAGSFPTSYIPTSGTQVTRSADVASIPVTDFGYNQKAGTVVVDWDLPNIQTDDRVVTISQDTTSRVVDINYTGSDFVSYSESSGNVNLGNLKSATGATTYKIGQKTTGVMNGGTVYQSPSNYAYREADNLYIGRWSFLTDRYPNGHIKSIQYYPRRLTNTQLQELTS